MTTAAELFDLAAHEGRRPRPACHGQYGYQLRALARQVGLLGGRAADREIEQVVRLLQSMIGLIDALAELRTAQRRLHQADAARVAASRSAAMPHEPLIRPVATAGLPGPTPHPAW